MVLTSTDTLKDALERLVGLNRIVPFKPLNVPFVLKPKFFTVNFTSLLSSTGLYCCAFTVRMPPIKKSRLKIVFIFSLCGCDNQLKVINKKLKFAETVIKTLYHA